jgi:DUF1680 family protein
MPRGGRAVPRALAAAAVLVAGLAWASPQEGRSTRPAVPDQVPLRYVPAPLGTQRLDGMLGDRLAVNTQKRLLVDVDPEPLLKGYRQRPGQQTWIGEHIGKFIDAATNAWAYSGDARLKVKLDRAVRDLLATQLDDGYLGTYVEPDRFKDYGGKEIEPNEKEPLWDVWTHKYNLIALLNYYQRTGYQPALAASTRIGDLLIRRYGEGRTSIAKNDWHVGMANTSVLEPMALLYRLTGDARYLDFCRYIVRAWDEPKGARILTTLLSSGRVNEIGNGKAYEMSSNFVGLLELYRATGEASYLRAVQRAWDDIVRNRRYLTGTASWAELFRGDHLLRADGKVGEGCVTTTWMQMNLKLLELTGEGRYADEIERTVYNALIGAQHPESGRICYFLPLDGTRQYGTVSQGVPGVSCCSSSVPRALTLIPSAAWGIRNGGIAVNLFVPGTARLPLPQGDVTVEAATRYPVDGDVTLTLRMSSPMRFPLSVRVPSWSRTLRATTGGRDWTDVRDGFVEIDRTWKDGDTVSVRIDLTPVVISGAPTYPDLVAVQRGPQVLAADERLNPGVSPWMNDLWLAGLATTEVTLRDASASLPSEWKGTQAYTVDGYVGNAQLGRRPMPLVLVPIADAGQTGGEYRTWLQRP